MNIDDKEIIEALGESVKKILSGITFCIVCGAIVFLLLFLFSCTHHSEKHHPPMEQKKGISQPYWEKSKYEAPNPYREWHKIEAETCCRQSNVTKVKTVRHTITEGSKGETPKSGNGSFVLPAYKTKTYLTNDKHCLNNEDGYYWTDYYSKEPFIQKVCVGVR